MVKSVATEFVAASFAPSLFSLAAAAGRFAQGLMKARVRFTLKSTLCWQGNLKKPPTSAMVDLFDVVVELELL